MEYIMENFAYIGTLVLKTLQGWGIKLTAGVGIAVSEFFFDSVQEEALIALLVLIVFDFLSALLCANKAYKPIESRKVFKTALKILVYFGIISAAFVAENAIPFNHLDDVIIGFLVVTELVSILENAAKAGYAVPKGILNLLEKYNDKEHKDKK